MRCLSVRRSSLLCKKGSARHAGFTIVELMVTLTIAAVLLGVGLPAFNGFIEQRNMTSRINSFVSAVNYARSEAARLGGDVSVQANNGADGNNEWGPGFCVVQGSPGSCAGPALRRFDGFTGATLNAVGGLGGRSTLTFNSRGMFTGGVAGTVRLCGVDADDDPGRVIDMNLIGRVNTNDLTCF